MTDTETVINLLRKVPLFASLKDEDKVCVEETEEWRLPAGEMLVEEGEHAEHFFVLLEGEISVSGRSTLSKMLSSLATDLARFLAKSRCYLGRLTRCPDAPSAIAG